MSATAPGLPPRLRAEILGDLEPVRPLGAPSRRAFLLALPALAALALALLAAANGWSVLAVATPLAWACSFLQWSVALLLLWMALRESVPGFGFGPARIALALAAGVALQLGIGFALAESGRAAEGALAAGLECAKGEGAIGLPYLALAAFLALQALPVRAAWSGALAGAAAGLLADALWHLTCPRLDLAHLLTWHLGSTLALAAVGWLAGTLWARTARVGSPRAGRAGPGLGRGGRRA